MSLSPPVPGATLFPGLPNQICFLPFTVHCLMYIHTQLSLINRFLKLKIVGLKTKMFGNGGTAQW